MYLKITGLLFKYRVSLKHVVGGSDCGAFFCAECSGKVFIEILILVIMFAPMGFVGMVQIIKAKWFPRQGA